MSSRQPHAGDAFVMDGFLYQLKGTKLELDENEQPVTMRLFERPIPADPALMMAHLDNFNYKAGGKCANAELIWMSRAEYVAQLREQATAVLRGNPGKALWAAAHLQAAEDIGAVMPDAGAWALPGRLMLRTTMKRNRQQPDPKAADAWVDDVPAKLQELIAQIARLQASTYHQPRGI